MKLVRNVKVLLLGTHHQIMVSLCNIPFPTQVSLLVTFSQSFRRSGFYVTCSDTGMNFEGLWDFGAPAVRWLESSITSLNPGHSHIGMFPGASWSLISFLLPPLGGSNNSLPRRISGDAVFASCTAALPSIGWACFFTSLGPSWSQLLLWQMDQGRSNGLGIWSPGFRRL